MDRTLGGIDLAGVHHVHLDTSKLAVLDSSAAWRLREFIERVRQLDGEIVFDGGEPEQLRLITDCLARAPWRPPSGEDHETIEPVEVIGRQVVRRWRNLLAA